MIDKIDVRKEYWYFKIPIGNPRCPKSYIKKVSPQLIKFLKIDSYGFVGTSVYGDNKKLKLSRTDLFETFDDCVDAMLEEQIIRTEKFI